MKARSTTSLAMLALVFLVAIWSYNWIVMKSVLLYAGPFSFAALRTLSGSALLFLLLLFMGRRIAPPPLIPVIAIGFTQTAGMTGVSQLALVYGGAGNTAILVYTLPFWMIMLAALFLKEKITGVQMLALVFAGVGLTLVMQPWHGGSTVLGSCLAVFSGFLWACGAILNKALFRKHPEIEVLSLTAWQTFFGSLGLGVLAFGVNEKAIDWSEYLIFALGYNAFLATAVAGVLWLFILRSLPTSISGLSLMLVPVTSVLLAWVLLDEVPDNTKLLGILCIVTGLLLTSGAFALLRRAIAGRG
ncbi:DMT family transporter [Desulfovibrio sp. OttesenSCG-928-G15]|nr:DMT family transporter [Desulfovibrio sp. OttesenSCG-928-G15]